jgi:hypothetical protein
MTPTPGAWFTIATFEDIPIDGGDGQKKARESFAFRALSHSRGQQSLNQRR